MGARKEVEKARLHIKDKFSDDVERGGNKQKAGGDGYQRSVAQIKNTSRICYIRYTSVSCRTSDSVHQSTADGQDSISPTIREPGSYGFSLVAECPSTCSISIENFQFVPSKKDFIKATASWGTSTLESIAFFNRYNSAVSNSIETNGVPLAV